jgi:hypothetical protein
MALKLLETKFIKDAWFGNTHYQTRLRLRRYYYVDLATVGTFTVLATALVMQKVRL